MKFKKKLFYHPSGSSTPTDLRKNINNDIVDIFIKTCNPMRKILLGANKPMQGLYIFFLTHENILKIGKFFESKLEQRQNKTILKALQKADEVSKYLFFYYNLQINISLILFVL